jgi:hypothetical protein
MHGASSANLSGWRSHSIPGSFSLPASGIAKGVLGTQISVIEPHHHKPDIELFRNEARAVGAR